jgi:hypothetical protein
VTESLTTDLSRMVGSFVIGRNTAFTYKGKHVDLKRVGRELGVRYALEGSVQRSGNRMRINIQLIDTQTGNHLWAERFDKPVGDLFDMQDEIISRLAGSLNAQLVAAEARRAERTPDPNSLDLYFQGLACANQGWTPEHMTKARAFFARASMLDPNNIEALVGTAMADAMSGSGHMTDERAARFASAEAALTKALYLVPEHASAHMSVSFKFRPTAHRKESPNVGALWNSIEIWRWLTDISVLPSISAVRPRRRKAISRKRCA